MEFDRFPIFSGIGGLVEWKPESLELCTRICLVKRFDRSGAFRGMQGNGLERVMEMLERVMETKIFFMTGLADLIHGLGS